MLRWFRNFRRSTLVIESKKNGSSPASKYTLYAIGEILLVVLGILIALQINNWNEWRKDRLKEQEIIKELRESVQHNQNILLNSQVSIDESIESSNIILKHLDNRARYSDSLMDHFINVIPIGFAIRGRTSESGYKALESAGLDILRHAELRKRVINLFEVSLPSLISRNEENQAWFHIYMSESLKNYFYLNQGFHISDYNRILNDPYFRTIVEHRLRQKRNSHIAVSRCIDEMEQIIELLNQESVK